MVRDRSEDRGKDAPHAQPAGSLEDHLRLLRPQPEKFSTRYAASGEDFGQLLPAVRPYRLDGGRDTSRSAYRAAKLS